MKKKGFTLIELLAVIAILGTIIAIVTMSAVKISNMRREQDYTNIKNIIVSNTKANVEASYTISDQVDASLSQNGEKCKIDYAYWISERLIDESTENPVNEKEPGKSIKDTCVKVTKNSTTYQYQYDFIDNKSDCDALNTCFVDVQDGTYTNDPIVKRTYVITLDTSGWPNGGMPPQKGTEKIYLNDKIFYFDKELTKPIAFGIDKRNENTQLLIKEPGSTGYGKNGSYYQFEGYYTQTNGRGQRIIRPGVGWIHNIATWSEIDPNANNYNINSDITLYAYWSEHLVTQQEPTPTPVTPSSSVSAVCTNAGGNSYSCNCSGNVISWIYDCHVDGYSDYTSGVQTMGLPKTVKLFKPPYGPYYCLFICYDKSGNSSSFSLN